MWEGLKGFLVSIPISVPLLLALFFCLKSFGSMWWLPVGSVLFFLSVVLARLAPVLIFPLFYTFKPLPDGELKSTILRLCQSVGMSVEGVYVFDMSKNTKKANAAFTGIGKSKRILLGDTLVANFRDDEIETVFAHELGHYKLRHLWTMLAVGTVSSFLGLYLTAKAYELSLPWFGFASLDQLAALPLLALWLGVYSLLASPLSNAISRSHERAADRYAITLTNNGEAFANALHKLARINLADVSPHPVIEFLFHSHPSIEKRVRALGTTEHSPREGGAQ
jgi:STE24 endopeptidase